VFKSVIEKITTNETITTIITMVNLSFSCPDNMIALQRMYACKYYGCIDRLKKLKEGDNCGNISMTEDRYKLIFTDLFKRKK
jgi:hypothetical protein